MGGLRSYVCLQHVGDCAGSGDGLQGQERLPRPEITPASVANLDDKGFGSSEPLIIKSKRNPVMFLNLLNLV